MSLTIVQSHLAWKSKNAGNGRSQITWRKSQKEWVLHVKHISSVPSVWDVHHESTAYVLDLSGDTQTLEKRSGKDHSIQSFICHEVRVLSNLQRLFLINFSRALIRGKGLAVIPLVTATYLVYLAKIRPCVDAYLFNAMAWRHAFSCWSTFLKAMSVTKRIQRLCNLFGNQSLTQMRKKPDLLTVRLLGKQ